MIFDKKRILIVGTGISGIAAVKLLAFTKADILLYDSNPNLNIEDIMSKLPPQLVIPIILGKLDEEIKKQIDYLVLSPGVPVDQNWIQEMKEQGTIVFGEIELAYQFAKGKIAAITGTNGKTTTATLLGEIVKTYYEHVFVAGNIGIPYTEIALNTTNDAVTVVEISSFQLETIIDFKPYVSAILNITPDHLNRHHTMEQYIEAKYNIAKNQTEEDTCVLNYEDKLVKEIGDRIRAKVIYFSSKRELKKGIFLKEDSIWYRENRNSEKICDIQELQIFGRHSYENVMAASAMAIALEIPIPYIHKALSTFQAVEHRIEYVETIEGVSYYNDSKGTNPDASIKAIEAMRTPTLLIAGGYDKGVSFDEWIDAFGEKVVCLVLLGQTAKIIAETARRHGFHHIVMAENLEEAVRLCYKQAKPGETVLLSPACASWGMFHDYEERGKLFKEYVRAVKTDILGSFYQEKDRTDCE